MENVTKFNRMVSEFGQHFGYDRQLNRETTAEDVKAILGDLEWLKNKIENLIDVVEDIDYYMSDASDEKNEVYTIGQYIAMGYSAEEAPVIREHDILWNRHIDGVITIQEANRLHEIWEIGIV